MYMCHYYIQLNLLFLMVNYSQNTSWCHCRRIWGQECPCTVQSVNYFNDTKSLRHNVFTPCLTIDSSIEIWWKIAPRLALGFTQSHEYPILPHSIVYTPEQLFFHCLWSGTCISNSLICQCYNTAQYWSDTRYKARVNHTRLDGVVTALTGIYTLRQIPYNWWAWYNFVQLCK